MQGSFPSCLAGLKWSGLSKNLGAAGELTGASGGSAELSLLDQVGVTGSPCGVAASALHAGVFLAFINLSPNYHWNHLFRVGGGREQRRQEPEGL